MSKRNKYNYFNIHKQIFYVGFAMLCITVMSCSERQSSIAELESFTQELKENSQYYDVEDWEFASQEFEKIIEELNNYRSEFSDDELRTIGRLKGECAVEFSHGAMIQLNNTLDDLSKEAEGFIDGISDSFE